MKSKRYPWSIAKLSSIGIIEKKRNKTKNLDHLDPFGMDAL